MLAKAHITVGMAAAFSVIMPEDAAEALPVIAGASLGCLICDIDCDNAVERTDSSHWRKVMACIAAVSLAADHLLDAGMWRTLAQSSAYVWAAGIAVFVLTCAFASVSSHRGFSHSLAALVLETVSIHLVFPAAAVPFAIAFITHLLLDIMNKRPVRLLYPLRKGFCLGWFYADRLADKVFAAAGSAWMLIAVIISLR